MAGYCWLAVAPRLPLLSKLLPLLLGGRGRSAKPTAGQGLHGAAGCCSRTPSMLSGAVACPVERTGSEPCCGCLAAEKEARRRSRSVARAVCKGGMGQSGAAARQAGQP